MSLGIILGIIFVKHSLEERARRFRTYVEATGMTASEVGRLSGVSQSAVHRFMHGERDMGWESAIKVAIGLGVSLDWLSGLPVMQAKKSRKAGKPVAS